MVSSIDPTKPTDGVAAVKADLRDNLSRAKNEIEALQAAQLPTGGAASQVLIKSSGADYDLAWSAPAAGQNLNSTLKESFSDADVVLSPADIKTPDGRTKKVQISGTTTRRFVNLPHLESLGADSDWHLIRLVVRGSGSLEARADPADPKTAQITLVTQNGTGFVADPARSIDEITIEGTYDQATDGTAYHIYGGVA